MSATKDETTLHLGGCTWCYWITRHLPGSIAGAQIPRGVSRTEKEAPHFGYRRHGSRTASTFYGPGENAQLCGARRARQFSSSSNEHPAAKPGSLGQSDYRHEPREPRHLRFYPSRSRHPDSLLLDFGGKDAQAQPAVGELGISPLGGRGVAFATWQSLLAIPGRAGNSPDRFPSTFEFSARLQQRQDIRGYGHTRSARRVWHILLPHGRPDFLLGAGEWRRYLSGPGCG